MSSNGNMSAVVDDDATTSQPMWTTVVKMAGDMDNVEPTKWKISPYAYEYTVNTIYLVFVCIVAVAGIFGNVMLIGAVLVHKKLRVLSNAFIVNLAVADLCVSLFVNMFNFIGLKTKGVFFYDNPILCEMLGSMCTISCCCSAWSIASIAMNRYVCICHRLIYPSIYNKRTLPFIILGLWLLSALVDLPNFFGWGRHVFDDKAFLCAYEFDADYSYTIFYASALMCVPFALLTYAYLRILMFSRATKKALKNVQNIADMPAGTSIKLTDLRLLKSILTIWVVFCILWMPYSVMVLFDFNLHWPRWIYIFSILLAHLTSSTNSIIYGVTNQNFRDGYAQFLRLIFGCGRAPSSKATAGMKNRKAIKNISQQVQIDGKENKTRNKICTHELGSMTQGELAGT